MSTTTQEEKHPDLMTGSELKSRPSPKQRKQQKKAMEAFTKKWPQLFGQSPSNPHGLSYRDAPAPEGGLRGGE